MSITWKNSQVICHQPVSCMAFIAVTRTLSQKKDAVLKCLKHYECIHFLRGMNKNNARCVTCGILWIDYLDFSPSNKVKYLQRFEWACVCFWSVFIILGRVFVSVKRFIYVYLGILFSLALPARPWCDPVLGVQRKINWRRFDVLIDLVLSIEMLT